MLHLPCREVRDGDDAVAALGGGACLLGEPGAEVGRGVIAADYEQVVERGDGPAMCGINPLVHRVEEIGGGS